MWFQKKKQPPAQQPFVPLPLDQVLALDEQARKEYLQAQARSLEAHQEGVAAEIRAIQERSAAHEREMRERMRQDDEETQRQLREISEQSVQQMTEEREKTANMMRRALNNPAYLAALQQALTPQPPAVPQLDNEQIIEGEILSSEEIQPPHHKETPA